MTKAKGLTEAESVSTHGSADVSRRQRAATAKAGELHSTLVRQLRLLDLNPDVTPSPTVWRQLLGVLSTTYSGHDDERIEHLRSADLSAAELYSLHDELHRHTSQDTLTGLPNRAALIRHLDHALEASARGGLGLAVLFIDLDGFKQVNESLGHAVGDELLVLAGQRIRACARPTDVVARLGSDEFVVVCSNLSGEAIVTSMAARVVSQLAAPFPIGDHQAVVSASIGLVTTAGAGETAEHLLGQAGLAMNEAKLSGKARTTVFETSMQLAADNKFSVRNALGRAITGNELRVMYQPIVSLADEAVIGVEALVRWERPGHGLLSPDQFIPIAEESSLISAVDCWVLQEACRRGARWCDVGGTIAVNLSARTLRQDNVIRVLSQALETTGISPGQLTMEITETALLRGMGTTANLGRLRDLGVQLSIDDFGTGHSSLSQLQEIDVDILKIDQSFVSRMDHDASSAAIVMAIITLGHALGLTIVAEGVERLDQAVLLRQQGCDTAQGWLYRRPLPAEAIDAAFGLSDQ